MTPRRKGRLAYWTDWLLLFALTAVVLAYGLALAVWMVPNL